MRRVEIAHERGLLIKMERVAWARLVVGWPATFNAQWAPRKAEVTQFKMSWRILELLHRKNMKFLTFCNHLFKEKNL